MANANASLDIPQKPAIRRAWVKLQLQILGSSLTAIADKEGVTRQAVEGALITPNAHLERAIAREIGVPVQRLFPERFNERGVRLHKERAPQRSRETPGRNVKRAGAR
jgi:lambda repressor-like predicted transcriptional regulator